MTPIKVPRGAQCPCRQFALSIESAMDNNRDTDFVDSGGGGRTAYGSRRRHGNNADYDSAREVNNEACGEIAIENIGVGDD